MRNLLSLSSFVLILALLAQISLCNDQPNETKQTYPIKHVVVLMMENRSYDHMLGWMKAGGEFGNPQVDGLSGKECNFKHPKYPWLGKICVSESAPDHSEYDPFHSFRATTERIFNCHYSLANHPQANITDPCQNHGSIHGKPTMEGFVYSARNMSYRSGKTEMSAQKPSEVPIITTLANEFTQFDKYFSSYPGSTNPNRMFMHLGTCNGCIGNEQIRGEVKNTTLQEVLAKNNLSWRYYFEGNALDWFLYIDYFSKNFHNKTLFPPMEQFYSDVAAGNLANYTFINPSETAHPNLNNTKSYGLMNDQHPDHSIKEGERLIKNVYEALRASPAWNETLLILNYDEHGGFYDHVPPPQDEVPNPDGKKSHLGFNYTRLGLRVPMILISPWIDKNVVVHEPTEQQKPKRTSQFEHSSIISSVLRIFGIDQQLSKRTEWAATFDDLLLSRTEPRTDCPLELPYMAPPTSEDIERLYNLPLKDRLRERVVFICDKMRPHDDTCGKDVITYKDLVEFVKEIEEELDSMAVIV